MDHLTKQAVGIRKRIVELAYNAGKNGAHIGGALSAVEILLSLYAFIPVKKGVGRDRVILSKGHAALAHYAVLQNIGVLTKEETDTFETNGTHFYAHAPRNVDCGLEFSGGSLSLGLSFSVGVALSCKKKGIDNSIYTIVGDGECNEGLVWEAIMAASNYHLDNLTVIVDRNKVQYDGPTSDVMDMSSLSDKFKAFGFDTIEVDGHDVKMLFDAYAKKSDKPKAIIAHTIKGKGLSFAENSHIWHHNVLTEQLYNQAIEELGEF